MALLRINNTQKVYYSYNMYFYGLFLLYSVDKNNVVLLILILAIKMK